MDIKRQNKGKSASTSITNIAIRFHADDEELEQVVQTSSECQGDHFSKEGGEDDTSNSSTSQLSPTSTLSDITSTSSTSSASSTCVIGRLGKRSSSLESAAPADNTSGDAWRLFKEVRGRITKTVEEKIEEIKSDRLKSSKNKQKSKLGTKVEHSSISDSEDISESSTSLKITETPIGSSKEKKDCDNSQSKNDNQTNDSGRSTPLIVSSLSEKDTVKDKIIDDDEKKKEIVDDFQEKPSKKVDIKLISSSGDEKKLIEDKKKDFKVGDEPSKKEKKSRRFHFRDRFQSSPAKSKKHEMSITFSSLKDEESDEEQEHPIIEFGLEASESENTSEPVTVQNVPLMPTLPLTKSFCGSIVNFFVIWKYAMLTASLAIAHYIWPFSYLLGLCVGVFLTFEVMYAVDWAQKLFNLKDSTSLSNDYKDDMSTYNGFTYPIFASSQYFSPEDNPEKIIFEGWMNEFTQDYSPDNYHISLTDTVHIKLEGSLLTISNPSTKIPKRASWNEPDHKKLFNRQRLFDIAGCKVQLVPVGLTHKRIWSKKYPICITLLKMSKIGVRYRNKGKITIENDQPWVDPEIDARTPVDNNDIQDIFTMDPLDQSNLEDEKSDHKFLMEGDKLQISDDTPTNVEEIPKEKEKFINGDHSLNEDDDDEDFVRISPSLLNEFSLYLFARCDRQKEIWLRRLVAATGFQSFTPTEKETFSDCTECEIEKQEEKTSKEKQPKVLDPVDDGQETNDPTSVRYLKEKLYLDYMNRLGQKKVPKLPPKEKEPNSKQTVGTKSSPTISPSASMISPPLTSDDMYNICEEVMWVNAFSGRLLYDVLRDSFWLNKIQEKFQRKLSAIKLPYFMEELVISHIDFGETVPLIQGASKPIINEDGIWTDLDIIYEGHFQVTIDTKLNLMKLKKAQATLEEADATALLCTPNVSNVPTSSSISNNSDIDQVSPTNTNQKSAIFDSDVEDSAESSSEEIDIGKGPITLPDVTPSSPGSTTSHKMLRMVDKIAASKYFQQVTEYKYIKRAMEGVSNTNIALVVEVRGLTGTLVLNFPPPPSDRLWYGFRPNARLHLSAQPKVGDRTITLLHISTFIEKQLRREFEKLLVLPNMDDLIIPVMNREQPS